MGLYIDIVNGWQDGCIYDIPTKGIKETIEQLRKEGNTIIVYSTRCSTESGREAIEKWLKEYGIKVDEIAAEKPIAHMYIDDRAIHFNGICETLLKDIKNFKVWTDGCLKTCPECGKEFFMDDLHKRKQKYCSEKCRDIVMKRQNKESGEKYRNRFKN